MRTAACIASGSTSQACWPVKSSASRKSTTAFGSPASCATISDTSTWSRKPCNLSTTRSARGCHPCLRYDLSPMCPGWTRTGWLGWSNSNYEICQDRNPFELRREFLPDLAKRMIRDVSRVSCALATFQLRQRNLTISEQVLGAVMYSAFECGRLAAGPDVIR